MEDTLLETNELVKSFPVRRGFFGQYRFRLVAVDHVNLTVKTGETLGLVGESGCGKSTLGLTIMRLYEPTSGTIKFAGMDWTGLGDEELRKQRRLMQMIFQDPLASLDPRMTVEEVILEPMEIFGVNKSSDRISEVRHILEITGMPSDSVFRFPTEFSGGQQQRIGIARALVLQPKILICDEPVSALDVSVQAQILNLLRDIQEKFNLSYIFISHNIAVTAFMSRRIGVMYLGKLVEVGPSQEITNHPAHPYTKALINAVPEPEPKRKKASRMLSGDVPSPIDRPSGCPFHPRCYLMQDRCKEENPLSREISSDHFVACHFV
jgi:oligopeptide/dipeptide ABC transporter ATP-binding protein